MFYKKVTSRDHKWFFLLRYGDLKEGLEMWSSRSSVSYTHLTLPTNREV